MTEASAAAKTAIIEYLQRVHWRSIGDMTEDNQALRLLAISVGKVLFKVHTTGGKWQETAEENEAMIGHICDWLVSSVLRAEHWLTRVDDKQRPLKLMKMNSLEQISKEADKAMLKASNGGRTVELDPSAETLVMEFPKGYRLVRLMSPQALDVESAFMQHCIGHGSYDTRVVDGTGEYYSLRDRSNRPHATLELTMSDEGRYLEQLRGKQNVAPLRRYLAMMSAFFAANPDIDRKSMAAAGYLFSKDGALHHDTDLPDGVEFAGAVKLMGGSNWRAARSRTVLPSGLKVGGHLTIGRDANVAFGDGTLVTGDLMAFAAAQIEIAASVGIQGSVNLDGSKTVIIGDNVHFRRNLVLRRAGTASIGSGVVVDGDLDIIGSGITALPDDIAIRGKLIATDTSLEALPAGLSVGQSLLMSGSTLPALPPGLRVGKNLVLGNARIVGLPAGLFVAGTVSITAEALSRIVSVADDVVIEGGFLVKGRPVDLPVALSLDDVRTMLRAPSPPRSVAR
jgi:hypothetical protein